MFNQNNENFGRAFSFPPSIPQGLGIGGVPPTGLGFGHQLSLPPGVYGNFPHPSSAFQPFGVGPYQDQSDLSAGFGSLFLSQPPPPPQNFYNQNPQPPFGGQGLYAGPNPHAPFPGHSHVTPPGSHFSKRFGDLANVGESTLPNNQSAGRHPHNHLPTVGFTDLQQPTHPSDSSDTNKSTFGGQNLHQGIPAANDSNQNVPTSVSNQGTTLNQSPNPTPFSFAPQSQLPHPPQQSQDPARAGTSLFQTNSNAPTPPSNPFGPTPQQQPAGQSQTNSFTNLQATAAFGSQQQTPVQGQEGRAATQQSASARPGNSQSLFGSSPFQAGHGQSVGNSGADVAQAQGARSLFNNGTANQAPPNQSAPTNSLFSSCFQNQQPFNPGQPSPLPNNGPGLFSSHPSASNPGLANNCPGPLFKGSGNVASPSTRRPSKYAQYRKEMLIDTPFIQVEAPADEPEEPIEVEDLIKLELETRTPKIQKLTEMQKVPLLVSLKPKEQDPTTVRRMGLDLVILMDVSGSMAGSKIRLLVESLNFIVEQLAETDRLALVAFSHQSTILTNLQPLTKVNKEKALEAIGKLEAGGGTYISHALIDGFDILLNRTHVNDTSAIILLSDGQDTRFGSDEPSPQAVLSDLMNQMTQKKMEVRLSCFGYGAEHDEKMLTDLSDPCGGHFYYIRELATIDEAFIECVGYLMSVVATDVELGVWALGKNRLGHKYGNNWTTDGANRASLKLGTLACGIERNFVLDLEVAPAGEVERAKTLTVSLSFSLRGEYHFLVKEFEVEFTDDEETGPVSQKLEQNMARLRAVEVLKQTRGFVQNGQKDTAGQLIDSFKRDFLSPARVGAEFASKMNAMVSRNLIEDNKQLSQNAATFGQQRPTFAQNSLFQANNVQASLFGSKKG